MNSNKKFPKSEKLCSKKIIEELFSPKKAAKSSSTFLFPFKITYLFAEQLPPQKETTETTTTISHSSVIYPQIIISVSKKNFRRAVDRNFIKRQIREIYRQAKSELFANQPPQKIPMALGIVFVAKEKQLYDFMNKRFRKVMKEVK